MKQVFIRKGEVLVEEVPSPAVQPGCILVQTTYSCISTGTELSQLKNRSTPLWRKALEKPEHVKKALDMAMQQGILKTIDTIGEKLHAPVPSGYSASGVVVAVGTGVQEFQVGDAVACAGAQCAYHAEVISVPVNLAVKLSDKSLLKEASTVALGAIALQGVRRANPTLGESFLVVGLGALGLLTVQILRANGCQVFGADLSEERKKLAIELGASQAFSGADSQFPQKIKQFTGGLGVDGVILTASGKSEEILGQCFESCRKKGRVVLVGDVPLQIDRAQIYEKELDFFVSCSYGPGRYDANFEERGADYPLPYVRWTETRNMQTFVELLQEKKIHVSSLISKEFPVEGAAEAFRELKQSQLISAVFSYRSETPVSNGNSIQLSNSKFPTLLNGQIRLGIIGAGSFTKSMHGPLLKSSKEFQVVGVASKQGHSAKQAAENLGAKLATTNLDDLFQNPEIDAILVGTRHDLHASLAAKGLRSKKHVFVEKPTALTESELTELETLLKSENRGVLFTGFNRRYAPGIAKIVSSLQSHKPMVISYSMNAGFIAKDHWVHGPEGGGRNLGEACHIYDLLVHLNQETKLPGISALAIREGKTGYQRNDNFSVNLQFSNGSVASFIYTAMGNPNLPKEVLTIYQDQTIFQLTDYSKLEIFYRNIGKKEVFEFSSKGHKEEWDHFAKICKDPRSWNREQDQFLATRISFEVEKQISSPNTLWAG